MADIVMADDSAPVTDELFGDMAIPSLPCTLCGIEKPRTTDYFYRNPMGRDGLSRRCKTCHSVTCSTWASRNKQRCLDNCRRHRAKVKEAKRPFIEAKRRKREATADERKRLKKEYYKRWKANNRDKVAANARRWYEQNKHKPIDRDVVNRKRRERLARDPIQRVHSAISRSMRASLVNGKGGRTWTTLVGYSVNDLKVHLERQFRRGMSWSNYGSKWEIDHIVPLYVFRQFESEHDPGFKHAWALTNLRPLFCEANKRKSAKRIYLV